MLSRVPAAWRAAAAGAAAQAVAVSVGGGLCEVTRGMPRSVKGHMRKGTRNQLKPTAPDVTALRKHRLLKILMCFLASMYFCKGREGNGGKKITRAMMMEGVWHY